MAFTKVVLHQSGPSLSDPQVGAHVTHHLVDIRRTDAAECVCLYILVQQLIRIQFRTVRRQAENSDLCSAPGEPAAHRSRLVHWVAIDNEKYFPPALSRQAQQAAEKIQEHPCREALPKNHEGQPPAIGNGRDHVAAKTLPRAEHHRGLPAASVTASGLMVRTQPHLIQPMNLPLNCRAPARIPGYSSASHFRTATGFCS